MSKKKQHEVEVFEQNFDMDFDDMLEEESGSIAELMSCLMQTGTQQMQVAVELTKIITANNPEKQSEDYVFSVFKKSKKVVEESFSLDSLMKHFQE